MKQKLFYLVSLFALSACGQASYKNTSLSPDERAELLVKELTLEEKAHLMMDGPVLWNDWVLNRITGGMRRCMALPGQAWLQSFLSR